MIMVHHFIRLTVGFAVLTMGFWAIEFFWPGVSGQRRVRRGFFTDSLYWFFTPLISKPITQFFVLLTLAPIFLLLGHSLDRATLVAGYGPVLALPKWLQAFLILFVGDVIGYWTHRWFHGRRLWAFHAVHHSSEDLDWLSSVRQHPVNEIASRVCQALPFGLLGFSPALIAAYIPFLTFYAIFVHANVTWRYGMLQYVVASPEFHRWHHTSEEEGRDKNFAGLFPVIDMVFGTFYLPVGKHPTVFGARGGAPVPPDFYGQMMYPFRRRPTRRKETQTGKEPEVIS